MENIKLRYAKRIAALSDAKKVMLLDALRKEGVDFRSLPIVPRNQRCGTSLSFAQERQWFLWELDPGSSAYHMAEAINIRGRINVSALRSSFEELLIRHEILRTNFRREKSGLPLQIISEGAVLDFREMDVRSSAEPCNEGAVNKIVYGLVEEPFDLTTSSLIRIGLIFLADDEYILVIVMHHIVSDARSIEIIVNELSACYSAALQGGATGLAPLPIQYADYASWQRSEFLEDEQQRQMEYWVKQLEGPLPVLELFPDHPKRADGRYRRGDHAVDFPVGLASRIRDCGRENGATPFMISLAGFAALLNRYTGLADICVGVPITNRSRREIRDLIGFFVNTQVLRLKITEELSLGDLLVQVKRVALEAQDNQDLPFERVVEALNPERSLTVSPLFQVMFNFLASSNARNIDFPGVELDRYEIGEQAAQFELTLTVSENRDGRMSASFGYAKELFEAGTIERMAKHYLNVLEGLVIQPQQVASDVSILSEIDREQLASWGMNTERYPNVQPFHELIKVQAAQRPDASAVVFGEETLSYGELNAQSNRLAHRLIRQGVRPEARVGVALERSTELVVTLLAILKVGGAYVPLDPELPAERLAYMAGDSGIGLLLTHSELIGRVPNDGVQVIEVDRLDLSAEPTGNPGVSVTGENLAYVIYTSGSTGQPKGVAVRHAAVSNCLLWMQQAYELAPDETVLHKAPFGFDVSVWELFWPLTVGARLVVAAPGEHRDVERLVEVIREQGVTAVNFVPTMLKAFLSHEGSEGCTELKHIMCGGEAVGADLQRDLARRLPATKLHDLYGPTETTIHVTHWTCAEEECDLIPIGSPITDSQAYVLDGHLNLVPRGVPGELYIGGKGLARGYLNRPGLTAERFVADPFDEEGGRLYRTGDLVRWNVEGQLEYLGRLDHQVKVRGFRIELGEIEAKLLRQPEVREAVVIAGEGPGGMRLVGYVSLKTGQAIDSGELRERLGWGLPDYMVPSVIVVLEALPLNANGKIDRKALPAPEFGAESEYEAPVGEVEETLAQIWAEVLEVERVGRNDDFFQLGGHSLLALKLLERIRSKGHAVQVRTLFEHPKLAEFARAIGQGGQRRDVEVLPNLIAEGCERIEPEMVTLAKVTSEQLRRIEASVPGGASNIQDIYPLAPLQEGILFHHLLQERGDVYITSHGLSLDTKERLEGFIESFNRVIARHDILRTGVQWEGLDEPVQVVQRRAELKVRWVEKIGELGDYRIDVRQAPLIHALAARDEGGQRWRLQILAHHLVLDHTTLELVIGEIGLVQQQREAQLPEPVPFRSFVAQARLGVSREEHEAYFHRELGDVEEPTAPFGLLDIQGDGSRIEEVRVELEPELAQAIRQQAKRHGVSAAALFHLAWALVLARTTGRDDVVFGTMLFGRMQGGESADRALGMFLNMLPLRVRLAGRSIGQCLKGVQRGLTELLHHEHAPLTLAQRCSGLPSGTPLFSAMLNYRHSPGGQGSEEAPVWQGIESTGGIERTNYPFTLSVDDVGIGYVLVGQIDETVGAERVCSLMRYTLEQVSQALGEGSQEVPTDIALVGQEEFEQLALLGVNAERYLEVQPIHKLVEAMVEQRPEAVAVVFGEDVLNYGELNARANRLAHRLIGLDVGPEVRVGVALERSPELVVTLLAILKAGGAYVPLDPDYPGERLVYMVDDSGIGLLVTHSALAGRVPADGLQIVEVDQLDLADESTINPGIAVTGENLAYVIYTSGSTGMPKGAANRHSSLYNRLEWMQQAYGLDDSDTVLQKTPYSFDVSVWEFFWPLITGAKLAVANPGDHRDPQRLVEQIRRNKVTTLHFVPSMLQAFLAYEGIEACTSVKRIVCSGEALPAEAQASVFKRLPQAALYNLYGPTEAAIDVTHWTCRQDGSTQVPIGRPIADTKTYVLDGNLNLAPQGVPGELYLGGTGLARGYLNRPALTAERFVADPFDEAGGRLYRTGDLVKWNVEGQLEYLGRLDHQVKMRGFRIELGEIEAKLLAQKEVREAVVVAGEGPGGTRLVGYISLQPGQEIDSGSLREGLGRDLPEYMVPSVVMVLEALPLNANGKIDRKALPAPEFGAEGEYEAPVGEVEATLAQIWADVLKVPLEIVGRNSNFFELGGDSISVLKVQMQTIQSLGVQVSLREHFLGGRLKEIGERLHEARCSSWQKNQSDVELISLLLDSRGE